MSTLLRLPILEENFDQEQLKIFQEYQRQNPEFSIPRSVRAQMELVGIFYNKDGSEKHNTEVNRARQIFIARIKALIPQLQESKLWQAKKAVAEQKADDQVKKGPVIVAAGNQEFQESSINLFKSLQKIFTAETERLTISNKQSRELGNDYSGIIIDTVKLNRKKLENMELEDFIPPKRTRREKQLEYFEKAIPQVKEALKDLEPFVIIDTNTGKYQRHHNYRNARLLRIGTGNVTGNRNHLAGYILGMQNNNGVENCYISTIHDAKRRIDEIDKNHNREVQLLMEIKRTMSDIDELIAKNWQLAKTMLPDLKKELLEIIGKLSLVSDKDKVRLKEKITKALDFSTLTTLKEKYGVRKDGTRGVIRKKQQRLVLNPGATRAKWAGFDKDIALRLGKIKRIATYLTVDKIQLQESISNQQILFNQLFKQLSYKPERFKLMNYRQSLTPLEVKILIEKLKLVATNFETDERKNPNAVQFFEPYLSLAERISKHAKKTIELLSTATTVDDKKEVAKEFTKIYSMAAAAQIYMSFQIMHDDLVGGRIPYFNGIRRQVDELKKGNLSKPFGSKDIRTNQYSKILIDLWKFADGIDRMAMEGAKAVVDRDDKQTKKICEEMKKSLRTNLKIWNTFH